ncbi:MAG: DUF2520 domain-containing protein [Gemmatimonadota bacterium]|nr:DUF2520 domain-containing protein [Gemmatimonadota bacterium]
MSEGSGARAPSDPPSIFLYGAGRTGLAVALRAHRRGVEVEGIWSRRPLEPARDDLARELELSVGYPPPAPEADLWLLAVPDDAIGDLATRLAAEAERGSRPRAAAHCAGARPAAALAPLAGLGVAVGSWHPAMTFGGAPDDADALAGAVVALEGEEPAREILASFTRALGATPVVVAEERKPLYHAALVLASNGRVALTAAAERMLAEAGIGTAEARSLLRPLVERTEQNLAGHDPLDALTGPVARGDAHTVRLQLEALDEAPSLAALYRALGRTALELVPASRRGPGHRAVARILEEVEC